jgi:hypothetical protein
MVEVTGVVGENSGSKREPALILLSSEREHHTGGVGSITANEDTGHTTVETWMDITFKDGNRYTLEEVGVQKWEGDEIIHERFYYNMPG